MDFCVDDAEIARQSVAGDGRRDSTSSLHQVNGSSLSPGAGSSGRCAPGVAIAASDRHIGTWNPSPAAAQPGEVARTNGEQQHFTFGSASPYVADADSTGLCVAVGAGVACGRERSTLGAIDEEQSQAGSACGVGVCASADGLLGGGVGHSVNESGFVGSPPFPAHHQQQCNTAEQGPSRLALGRLRYNSGPAAFSHALNTQHSFPPLSPALLAPTNTYPPELPASSLLDQLFVCSVDYSTVRSRLI